MRDLLLKSVPVFTWVFAAVHLVFMIDCLKKHKKTKDTLYVLIALVAFGLFYDALILSFGSVMAEGALLKSLSQLRYISHGALIPLLIPICAYSLDFKKTAKTVVWVITAALIVSGIASGVTTVTIPENVAIVRYACDASATPGWSYVISTSVLAYGMVIPLVIAGIAVWIKRKTPLLFLSGFLMFAFSALGPATGNFDLIFYISMFGELLMILFMYLYAGSHSKQE